MVKCDFYERKMFNLFLICIFAVVSSMPMNGAESTRQAATSVGESVTLPCPRTVDSPVNWWYQASSDSPVIELCVNGELINGNKKRFNLDKKTSSLTLVNATLNDAGIYTCIEKNGQGVDHDIQLTVSRSSRWRLTASVGRPFTLSCRASTMNEPVNWWYQTSDSSPVRELCVNGRLINGRNNRFSVDAKNYSLTIKEVQLTDAGVYTCIENMGVGEQYVTELNVVVSPETTPDLEHLMSSEPTEQSELQETVPEFSDGTHVNTTVMVLITTVVLMFVLIIFSAVVIAISKCRNLRRTASSDNDCLITSKVQKHLEFWEAHVEKTPGKDQIPDTVTERDIFVLTLYPELHMKYVGLLSEHIQKHHPDGAIIAGLDIRGLIFALPVAVRLRRPFVPISKSGKLSSQTIETIRMPYTTPDGQTSYMEVQRTECQAGQRVVIVDDELRTGASITAAIKCIRAVGGVVVECVVVMEVLGMGGREKIASCDEALPVFSLLKIVRSNNGDNVAIEMQTRGQPHFDT